MAIANVATTRLFSKGQVVIPENIRKRFKLYTLIADLIIFITSTGP